MLIKSGEHTKNVSKSVLCMKGFDHLIKNERNVYRSREINSSWPKRNKNAYELRLRNADANDPQINTTTEVASKRKPEQQQ